MSSDVQTKATQRAEMTQSQAFKPVGDEIFDSFDVVDGDRFGFGQFSHVLFRIQVTMAARNPLRCASVSRCRPGTTMPSAK